MKHVTIIAEAGVNHNGSLEMALQLVDAAADAGVDYVKFQTFRAENLVARSAPLAQYQASALDAKVDDGQLAMLRRLELSADDHRAIIEHCHRRGVKFLSTPFDFASIDFLASLGQTLWKIPSGEITNLPYLRRIAHCAGRVVMSTGMSTLEEVDAAMQVLIDGGKERADIALLHCNTQYPTPMPDVNLRAMEALRTLKAGEVGFSDHTVGIEVPIAAVAMGATIIEKHFTLDKSLPGPDHQASLDPQELAHMCRAIRNVGQALGSPLKHVTDSERPNIAVARKSIVAARPILKGEVLTEDNLTTKRPGTGLSPMMWDSVIGTRAARDFDTDDLISLS